jgi:hypothetical protein
MQSSLMAIAWNDPEVQNILLAGGSRGGKSAGIVALIINRALAAPNTKHGIFRLTLTNCNKQLGPARGTFPEVLDMMFPGYRKELEKKPEFGTFKSDSIFRFHNGSEILFEGLDKTRIDNVLGGEYEKKEAALYKALDYLTFYELRDYSQEVAANITKYDALVERAIIMLAPELANANSIAASPLVVKESSSVKQGLVAESKEYARPSADRFPQVTALLQPILVSSKLGGNGLMRIIRN